jgi:short-subunit dehydrogenase
VIGDLVDPVDTRRCVEAVCEGGAIQVLIHNAGISAAGRFQTIPLEVQLRVIDLNLIAPMVVTPALLRTRKLTSSASIVFVSSLSHFVGYPGASVYAATKDGIASYARSLRVSLGKKRHVLTVFPGPTRTEHARRYSPDNSRESKRMPPDVLADLIYRSVLKRRKRLIPGLTNKIISRMGNLFPVFTERMMAKTMLRPGE